MVVAVGSTSPPKIECVRDAFTAVFGSAHDIELRPVAVDSGVRDQPQNEDETLRGATCRANNALAVVHEAGYGVGLEGGLVNVEHLGWFECAWICVVSAEGIYNYGSTARIEVPGSWVERILEDGEELGPICDGYFATKNCGKANGFFGLMTNDAVTRTSAYRDAVAFALAPFLHRDLFFKKVSA